MIGYDYRPDRGLFVPRIICDDCGLPITGAGNVYWLHRDDGQVQPGIWHTHKAPCSRLDRDLRRTHGPGVAVLYEEIHKWLAQLAHGIGAPC